MERGATCYSQGYREDIAAVVKGKREMTEACIKQRFSNFIEQRGWTALFNYFFFNDHLLHVCTVECGGRQGIRFHLSELISDCNFALN